VSALVSRCPYELYNFDLLLLLGGLRAPPKPISRKFALCSWPLMRPPGTAIGPWPFAPAIAPLES
jgi:hypothetical protein